jgi:hypothetical protein
MHSLICVWRYAWLHHTNKHRTPILSTRSHSTKLTCPPERLLNRKSIKELAGRYDWLRFCYSIAVWKPMGEVDEGEKLREVGARLWHVTRLLRSPCSRSAKVLSRGWSVTIDGLWIDDRIYWTPWHTTRDYILQVTITHTLVFTVTSSLSLLCSGFQWRTFPFLRVPQLSPASATSY